MFESRPCDDPLKGRSLSLMAPIIGVSLNYPARTLVDWHQHDVGQIVYAVFGTVSVMTDDCVALLPPTMALWVPPHCRHRLEFKAEAKMRTLYVLPDCGQTLGQECRVFHVMPLLRELIVTVAGDAFESSPVRLKDAITHLLFAAIESAPKKPLSLPIPSDPRVRAMIEFAMGDLSLVSNVAQWAELATASRKTVERIFKAETGLGLSDWLKQLKIMRAVMMLSDGMAVNLVAHELGYSTPSAFTQMFRSTLGVVPSKIHASNTFKPSDYPSQP